MLQYMVSSEVENGRIKLIGGKMWHAVKSKGLSVENFLRRHVTVGPIVHFVTCMLHNITNSINREV